MPFYTCIHGKGSLTEPRKQALAQGITDIHCGVTGAPRHFVHVLFQEYAASDCYSGGEPSSVANIRGSIRLGRSQGTKEEMLQRITELWRAVCPETRIADIVVSLAEIAGTNVMEGGVLLPHPNDDASWLARNGFASETPAGGAAP
jgi:phenylpyruvate tautomerase PptA (4-oxalocrotonate tautomerase family)